MIVIDFMKMMDIHSDVSLDRKEKFEKDYPDLAPYYENLRRAVQGFSRNYCDWCNTKMFYNDIDYTAMVLEYIKATNNKRYVLSERVINVMGGIYDKNARLYPFMYGSLFYPEDIKNYSISTYVSAFAHLIQAMFKRNFNKELFKNDERIYKFLGIIEELKTKYHTRFNNRDYQIFVVLLLSHCYITGDYDIYYNFLKDPRKYIEKIAVKGYVRYSDQHKSQWRTLWTRKGAELTFNEAPEIFKDGEEKVIL